MNKLFLAALLFIVIPVLFTSCMVSRRSNMAFIDKKELSKNSVVLSINAPVFLAKPFVKRALRKEGDEGREIARLVRKIKRVRVLTITNNHNDNRNHHRQYFKNNHYEELATIKSNGDLVTIMAQMKNDAIKNMFLIVNSSPEEVYVSVKGNFTYADISRLINLATDAEKKNM